MTTKRFTQRLAAFYVLAAILVPTFQPAFGAGPGRIADVGLTSTGALVGQVVDNQGKPVANSPVEISASGKKATLATTNDQGYFSFDRLPAGVYVAATPGTAKMVRVWAPRTAPPTANKGVLLVQPQATARAQSPGCVEFLQAHGLKLVLGGVAAAGIIALAENGNDTAS